jgi:hypothetical protein
MPAPAPSPSVGQAPPATAKPAAPGSAATPVATPGPGTPANAAASGSSTTSVTASAPNYGQVFWTAVVGELPKWATVALTVALGTWAALSITSKATARWDIRKKRQEFDILLVKEFYELIASFKSVAREAQALGPRPRPDNSPLPNVFWGAPVVAAMAARSRPQPTASPALEKWQARQEPLARRALDAEMRMEAILLKLISESAGADGLSPTERHAAGLLRTAFRNLRETVDSGKMRLPDFDDSELWLFNRLAGEISKIFYRRSVRSPNKPETSAPAIDANDYLRLVNYRTGDLEAAVARLAPKVDRFRELRHQARQNARRARVNGAFTQGTAVIVERLAAAPQPAAPILPAPVRVAVELANDEVTDEAAAQAGAILFAANADLAFYLVLADRPPRVIAVGRDGAVASYTAEQALPSALPWSAGRRPPVLADTVLGWDLDQAAEAALREVATVPLAP